jgi:hypothetical protein
VLSRGVSGGRKFSASSIRSTVTTSTVIWVSARSGADSQAKPADNRQPDDPGQEQRQQPVAVAG